MSEINFYQIGNAIDNPFAKAMSPLLTKIIDEGKKAIIYCQDEAIIKTLDTGLWSFGKNKFLPHITIFDEGFDLLRQPVLISDQEENSNKAEYLVLLDEATSAFVSSFERVFYFFHDESLPKVVKVRDSYQKIASKVNSYKKDGESGKWVLL